MAVTREEIYATVWSAPMRDVAVSYAVSGSFLTRVRRRMNVPCPPWTLGKSRRRSDTTTTSPSARRTMG
jgi:hypothetical protein